MTNSHKSNTKLLIEAVAITAVGIFAIGIVGGYWLAGGF